MTDTSNSICDLSADDVEAAADSAASNSVPNGADPQPGETWIVLLDPGRSPVLHQRRQELGLSSTPAYSFSTRTM